MKRFTIILLAFVLLLSACKGEEEFSAVSDHSSESEAKEINVSYCAGEGGLVSGVVNQTLKKGEGTGAVVATPYLCYAFKEWSDGVKSPSRSGDIFSENTVITAIFEYKGLPEIHISYTEDKIHRSRPIRASFSMENACGIYEFEGSMGQIQGRGNSTWEHEKKPYKIKFDKAVNLLGIGDDAKRDWVLLSNHCDQSLLRNYYAYNLAYEMGIGYKSTCVEVYLNGKYNGVYLLTGKVEDSRHDVDTEKGGFVIELDDYYEGEENVDYFALGIEYYSIHSGGLNSEQIKAVKEYIRKVDDAINGGSKKAICELVDIDSFVKMYLLQEYTKNTDAGWSSFYFYKRDDNDKLHMGPAWDFDIALGNDYRIDDGSFERIYVGRESGFTQQNWWFIKLCRMEWFRRLALDEWNGSFRTHIIDSLSELYGYAQLNFSELENNFKRWDNVFGHRINCEPDHIVKLSSYKEHYDFFVAWMNERFTWLDGCFNDEEEWKKQIKVRRER